MRTRMMVMALFVMALAIAPSASAIVYADANLTTGANDGSSWENAYQGAGALAAAVSLGSGEDIWVAAGTYSATIVMQSDVAILGGFTNGGTLETRDPAANVSIISASAEDAKEMCVYGASLTNASIDGFTLQNAAGRGLYLNAMNSTNSVSNLIIQNCVAGGGAGIWVAGSSLTISDCVVTGCQGSDNGGGALITSSTVVMDGCSFIGNSSTAGGGGAFVMQGATFRNCTFDANTCAWLGAGIAFWSAGGPWEVEGCTFKNHSWDTGGAICAWGGGNATDTLNVSDSYFENNAGYNGSAILMKSVAGGSVANTKFVGNAGNDVLCIHETDVDSHVPVTNCLFTGNTETGSCLFNYEADAGGGTVDVVNCTFAGNPGVGGAIVDKAGAITNVLNTVAWDNNPGAGRRDYATDAGTPTLYVNYSLFQEYPPVEELNPNPFIDGTGNLFVAPEFADAANDDYRLASGSPALDTGNASDALVPADDLLGAARPGTVAGVSMGAYEEAVESVLDPEGDEDGDGLTNGEEETIGTNPYLADTDEDTYSDKQEVDANTDPLDPLDFPAAGELPVNSVAVMLLALLSLCGGVVALKKGVCAK